MNERDSGDTLPERITRIRERIAAACERSGRNADSVTLVAVSKTFPAEAVAAAWVAGIRDFGENRVQEGVAKAVALAGNGIRPAWHLVGHLQRNKVRDAIGSFAILHAVDSERLLQAIDAAATAPVRVSIEVNVAGEPTKFGVAPDAVPALVAFARGLRNVRVEGLMTVAPPVSDQEAARPVFRRLRELARGLDLEMLSMGMTEDFEVAIEEGSTHVRIGRAIFGERA